MIIDLRPGGARVGNKKHQPVVLTSDLAESLAEAPHRVMGGSIHHTTTLMITLHTAYRFDT